MNDATPSPPRTPWRLADYREPLVLVCAGTDPGARNTYQQWRHLPQRNVRIVLAPPASRARDDALAGLARQVGQAVAGRPYALFGQAGAATTLLRLVPLLDGASPVSRLFVAAAVPPEGVTAHPVPISAMCGARDPAAPPAAMAGWRRLSAGPFSLQVFEGGADFLCRRPAEVLESVQQDLRVQRRQVPGCGFDLVDGW